MEAGLPIHPPPIEDVLTRIRAGLEEKKRDLPEERYLYKKITNWEGQIDILLGKVSDVKREVIQKVTENPGGDILSQDDILAVMVDDTTKNLFLEIGTEYPDGLPGVSFGCLQKMVKLPDDTLALAFLGDAVLLLGAIHCIWKEDLLAKGELDARSRKFKDNKSQAPLSTAWSLHENTIGFDHQQRSVEAKENHDKGTLVEALFGLIYIRGGMEAVKTAAKLLNTDDCGSRSG